MSHDSRVARGYTPHLDRTRARGLLLTGAAVCLPSLAGAQVPTLPGTAQARARPAPVFLERTVHDRWVHEGESAPFVPFDSTRTEYLIQYSRSRINGSGVMTLTVGQQRAQLFLEADNRMRSATVEVPPIAIRQNQDPVRAANSRRRRLVGGGAAIDPPDMRAWQVPFVMPNVPLVAGFEWTDTLSFTADPGEGLAASIGGVWRSRVVGDTTIGGLSLPVVRTEADVRYTAREPVRENASDELFVIERDVAGTIVGFAAIDTTRAVRAAGADTARWTGTATLRTSDGGVYPSGVRYDRYRSWTMRDSLAHVAYEDSLRAARRATAYSVVQLPRTPLEERLWAGDNAAADSLFDAWRATDDPDERVAIAQLLRYWRRPAGAPSASGRLLALRAELGDTATILENIIGGAARPFPDRLTVERLDSMLPYLRDIGRMWRLGIMPRGMYSSLADQVLRSSPILLEESSRGCEPEACARIAGLVDTVAEPRLNDVAIVAAFSLDPARWFDRLRDRAAEGSQTAGNALRAATGLTADGADENPVPPADAGWRDWLAWMNGDVRWRAGNRMALLFQQARTGRDPLASMQADWPPAEDSARLVLGTILRAMDRIPELPEPTVEQLASTFNSGSAEDVRAAEAQLNELLYRNSRPAPELAVELILPLLDSLFADGGAPWPQLRAPEPAGVGARPNDARPFGWGAFSERPVFMFEDAIPDGIADRLPALIQPITRAEWNARPVREGGALLSLIEPRVWGDFAIVGWSYYAQIDREPDEAPSGYAGSAVLFLMRTAAGWRVIRVGSTIT